MCVVVRVVVAVVPLGSTRLGLVLEPPSGHVA